MRLGDQNLATLDDGAEPVDYEIEEFIKHENYSRRNGADDIALIKLVKNVTFTDFVRPACLQVHYQRSMKVQAVSLNNFMKI